MPDLMQHGTPAAMRSDLSAGGQIPATFALPPMPWLKDIRNPGLRDQLNAIIEGEEFAVFHDFVIEEIEAAGKNQVVMQQGTMYYPISKTAFPCKMVFPTALTNESETEFTDRLLAAFMRFIVEYRDYRSTANKDPSGRLKLLSDGMDPKVLSCIMGFNKAWATSAPSNLQTIALAICHFRLTMGPKISTSPNSWGIEFSVLRWKNLQLSLPNTLRIIVNTYECFVCSQALHCQNRNGYCRS
jgi:hypothetical protein